MPLLAAARKAVRVACVAGAALGTLGTFGALGAPAVVSAAAANEYAVKAAFLYNFVLFTEWPAEAFPAPDAPLVVGIIGQDPFEGLLDAALAGQRVKGRPVVVRRFSWDTGVQHAHLLFIAASEARLLPDLPSLVGRRPVLTVADVPRAVEHGCVIGFRTEDAKVSFDINTGSAATARLAISSRVVALARNRVERSARSRP